MITCDLTGNFGNHMFQYAITRTVAEHNGYEFGFNRVPSHDYYNGMEQLGFMNIDYGKEHDTPYGILPKGIEHIWIEQKETFYHVDQVNFYPYQSDIFNIKDNTKLVISCCQNALYFLHNKEGMKNWFAYKDDQEALFIQTLKENKISLDRDLCVINVRGGEYLGIPNVLLSETYWINGIKHMLRKNPKMKFMVITDDIRYAKTMFDCPVYHFGIGCDYYILNHAQNLLLSNSSFAILPTWLNDSRPFVIAPEYWARHNVSNGYWVSSNIYTFDWNFLNREGRLKEYYG